ncbi:biotin synthase [Paucibacter sediminis]|uniref:Biotin synthase n=1 Tax=Paucibacter sediminis TaxID=3019553 RepID=A0AA95N7R0_9BURK|nr:biotin synthase [Paucibacter sp. S2-9]WIT09927.1 biotin synthase [Paucibacter sp. S2-9]
MTSDVIDGQRAGAQLDAGALRHQRRRLAAAPEAPWLHREVAQRMAERLPFIKLQPRSVLLWDAWLGASAQALRAQYAQAEQLLVEDEPALLARSQGLLKRGLWSRLRGLAQGAAQGQALTPAQVPAGVAELVWANMSLHAQAEPEAVLRAWHEALAVDGFLMFSCLGPDSLVELRPLYAELGWGLPAPPWLDMHDIGDMLVHGGFADPVMDQERLSLTWADGEALLNDMRALGGNVARARFAGLRGRQWRSALLRALERLKGPDGRLRLTVELVYGHAFKAAPKLQVQAETAVSLEQMRAMVKRPR